MGFIKGAMAAADLEAKLGFDTAIFTALPPPILYVTLGILGIVLWANMTELCDTYYETHHPLLLGIFHIQVIIMSIASVFGLLACWGMTMVVVKQIWPMGEEAKHRRDRHDDHLDVEDPQQQWVVSLVVGVAKLRHVGPQHNPQDAQRYIEDWRRERR